MYKLWIVACALFQVCMVFVKYSINRYRCLLETYLSVFCFSLSSSRYVCCNLSVSTSKFLVNLYPASNCSDNKTKSRVASCIGTSDIYNPFLDIRSGCKKRESKMVSKRLHGIRTECRMVDNKRNVLRRQLSWMLENCEEREKKAKQCSKP